LRQRFAAKAASDFHENKKKTASVLEQANSWLRINAAGAAGTKNVNGEMKARKAWDL
jgi:hypothetical protein